MEDFHKRIREINQFNIDLIEENQSLFEWTFNGKDIPFDAEWCKNSSGESFGLITTVNSLGENLILSPNLHIFIKELDYLPDALEIYSINNFDSDYIDIFDAIKNSFLSGGENYSMTFIMQYYILSDSGNWQHCFLK